MFSKIQAKIASIISAIFIIFIITDAANTNSWVNRAFDVALFLALLFITAFVFANTVEPSKDEISE